MKKKKYKFNLGAMMLAPYWAYCHELRGYAIASCTFLSPIIAVYLGFNGSEIAFKNQRTHYRTIEDFYEREKRWRNIGIVEILLLFLLLFMYYAKDPVCQLINNEILYNNNYEIALENTKNAEDMVRKIIVSEEFQEKTEGYSVDKNGSIDVYGATYNYLDYKNRRVFERARTRLEKEVYIDSCKVNIKGLPFGIICYWEFDFENNEIVYAKLIQNKFKICETNDNPVETSQSIIKEINKDEIKEMLK